MIGPGTTGHMPNLTFVKPSDQLNVANAKVKYFI